MDADGSRRRPVVERTNLAMSWGGPRSWSLVLVCCAAIAACDASERDSTIAAMPITADGGVSSPPEGAPARTATEALPQGDEGTGVGNRLDSGAQAIAPDPGQPPAQSPGPPDASVDARLDRGGFAADAGPSTDSGSGQAEEASPLGVGPEGDRRACLKPPWVPSPGELDARAVFCSSPTLLGFELGEGPLASAEQAVEFMKPRRLVDSPGIITVGIGSDTVCCDGGGWLEEEGGCVTIALAPLCVVPVTELIERIREWQLADLQAAQLRLRVNVSLLGRLEPRCPPGDCGPVPYTKDARWEGGVRTMISSQSVDGPRCADDGECFFSEANACLHWTEDYLVDNSPFYPELLNAFCGCVENRCAWFE